MQEYELYIFLIISFQLHKKKIGKQSSIFKKNNTTCCEDQQKSSVIRWVYESIAAS